MSAKMSKFFFLRQMTKNTGVDMGTGEYLFTVAGNKFWCSQCGNSVQCPQKARNRSTI